MDTRVLGYVGVPSHVGIPINEWAHRQAKVAGCKRSRSVNKLLYKYKKYYRTVRKELKNRCKVKWTNTQLNKL